ncbi:MAG: DNA translocase FtsK 4TM domain-containing protein, partial [Planctomycetes bacterium]|nr:DNA translocase FtsK 4TM domain-containing protein [Planctomycetota bacterium]
MPKTSTLTLSDTKLAQCREVAGILLLVFSAFGFVSLWTFHPGDVGGHVYPFNEGIRNAGGRLGAALASGLLMDLGLSAYFLVALAAFWGGSIFLDRPLRQFFLKAFGVLVFIVASATLLALLRPPVAAGAGG